jgi:Protein of unknown function (DUF3800)
MVTLHAFVDDSSSDVGDRRLFLAAYINGAGPWIDFGEKWRAALYQAPKISYLKMAEAQNLSGQFRGWSATDRDHKILQLARVIEASRPWSVHCSISRSEYAKIVAPVAPYPLKQPYFSCFWGIMRTAADYHLQLDRSRPANTWKVPPLEFIFDEQGGLGADAALWYNWLKNSEEPDIARLLGDTPIFGDDKQMVALQAADMLAWHVRRRHERGANESLPVLDILLGDGASRDIPTSMLKTWAEGFRRVPGVSEVQTKSAWNETRKVTRAMVESGAPPPDTRYWYLWRMNLKLKVRKLRQRWRIFKSKRIRTKS